MNFTTAMQDANYSAVAAASHNFVEFLSSVDLIDKTASAQRISCTTAQGVSADSNNVSVAIFR